VLFRSLILSNELVDAFPCRLFRKHEEGWEELGVRICEGGSLSEVSLGMTAPDPWFESFGELPTGQRVERFDSYMAWLAEWAPLWKQGVMLTVDYGDLVPKLYARRPGGSLRAYWKHQRFTGMDVYARFGRQDLTADVNFSDVITWGTAARMEPSPACDPSGVSGAVGPGITMRRRCCDQLGSRRGLQSPGAVTPCKIGPSLDSFCSSTRKKQGIIPENTYKLLNNPWKADCRRSAVAAK